MTPTPGQPLSEADVLLLNGDLLLCPIWGVVQFDRFDDSKRRAFVLDLKNNQVRLMVPAKMTFLGRPDQDGWVAWSGGENPAPGMLVDFQDAGGEAYNVSSDDFGWDRDRPYPITHWRPSPHAPVSRPGDGVEGAPGGWLIRESDGGWLWTGTRIAAVAALTEGLPVWSLSRNGYEPTGTAISQPGPASEGDGE